MDYKNVPMPSILMPNLIAIDYNTRINMINLQQTPVCLFSYDLKAHLSCWIMAHTKNVRNAPALAGSIAMALRKAISAKLEPQKL